MQGPERNPESGTGKSGPGVPKIASGIPLDEAFTYARDLAIKVVGRRRFQLAEDIAQTLFMRLIKKPPAIRHGWKAYVRTAVFNLARNKLRDQGARQKHLVFDRDFLEGAVAPELSPEEYAIQRETEKELAWLLAKIDEKFRKGTRVIVELRSGGSTWDEISGIVGISHRACSHRYDRAMEWLREQLSVHAARERKS